MTRLLRTALILALAPAAVRAQPMDTTVALLGGWRFDTEAGAFERNDILVVRRGKLLRVGAPVSAGIRLRRASLVLVLVATSVLFSREPATAQAPPCPSLQAQVVEPVAEFAPAAVASTRAKDWLRKHPMPITSLVATVPNPPKAVADRYLEPFGANAVHLWKDGPAQVEAWLRHRRGTGYITWLENNGNAAAWNGSEFVNRNRRLPELRSMCSVAARSSSRSM